MITLFCCYARAYSLFPLSLYIPLSYQWLSPHCNLSQLEPSTIQVKIESEKMIKLRAKKLFRSNSSSSSKGAAVIGGASGGNVIEWEVRPGGMLVQKRQSGGDGVKEVIRVRVSTGSKWHDMSIGATCTFGELKVVLALVTGLEPKEQRLVFRGREREDSDHLHMVGVKDADKVLLLEDPAIKERKLRALRNQVLGTPCHTIEV